MDGETDVVFFTQLARKDQNKRNAEVQHVVALPNKLQFRRKVRFLGVLKIKIHGNLESFYFQLVNTRRVKMLYVVGVRQTN